MKPAALRKLLKQTFADLRSQGIAARENFMCCQTCASSSLGAEPGGYVFWHGQDDERLRDGAGLHLAFSTVEVGIRAVAALLKAGVQVTWNGDEGTRIFVHPETNSLAERRLKNGLGATQRAPARRRSGRQWAKE